MVVVRCVANDLYFMNKTPNEASETYIEIPI